MSMYRVYTSLILIASHPHPTSDNLYPWYRNSHQRQSHLPGENTAQCSSKRNAADDQTTIFALNVPPGTHQSWVAWESFPVMSQTEFEPKTFCTVNLMRSTNHYTHQTTTPPQMLEYSNIYINIFSRQSLPQITAHTMQTVTYRSNI